MEAILADASAYGKLLFTGPDRRKFLNGLVTADVLKLAERRGTLSCLLTPKGLLRADFELYDRGEDLLALAVPKAAANMKEDLGRKLTLSETRLQDLSESFRLFYAGGPEAPGIVSRVLGAAELAPWEARLVTWRGAPVSVLSRPRLQEDGFWITVPAASAEQAWGELVAAGLSPVGEEKLEALRIARGVPLYGVDMDEGSIPQEARLDAALSFEKGCYLGQETISRVHHMGHVNKVLVRLRLEGESLPEPDAEVLAGGTVVGRLTSRAWFPSAPAIAALATVKLSESRPGTALAVRSQGKSYAAQVAG